jgi:uncharacterized protein
MEEIAHRKGGDDGSHSCSPLWYRDSHAGAFMNNWLPMILIVASACAKAGGSVTTSPETAAPCTDSWYHSIEEKVSTSDGQGHGPDVGSDEWKSVIEFKLGIRGKPDVPDIKTQAWCSYVDDLVRASRRSSTGDQHPGVTQGVRGPSYSCDKVEPCSIAEMICDDEELSGLDRKLSDVYSAATKKANNQHPPILKAEQRGWIKGRNECWKSEDKRGCVLGEYRQRIAELQARYRLVPGKGPFRYMCDGNPANEVVATFFHTDPPTLIAERGDSVSLMYLQPGGSGTKYQGRNETFWEHQGEALITWGYGAPQMRCKKAE